MLGPVRDDDAILLSGDLAEMTSASDPMERRLVRLAAHYRQRALMAEDALDNVVMAARDGRRALRNDERGCIREARAIRSSEAELTNAKEN